MAHGLDRITPLDLTNLTRETWTDWHDHFKHFLDATGITGVARRRSALLFAIGRQAFSRYNSLPAEDQGTTSYDATVAALESVLLPKQSVIFSRHRFCTTTQQPSQSIAAFTAELRNLVTNCKCPITENEYLRDQFIGGLANQRTRERLLQEKDDLSFDDAIYIAKTFEEAATVSHLLPQPGNADVADVSNQWKGGPRGRGKRDTLELNRNAVRYGSPPTAVQYRQQVRAAKPGFSTPCRNCGERHPPYQCPAYGSECSYCHIPNHFRKMCRKRIREERLCGSADNLQSDDSNQNISDEYFIDRSGESHLFTVSNQAGTSSDKWSIDLKVNGRPLTFKMDTGATISIIPAGIFPDHMLLPPDTTISAFMSKEPINCEGYVLTTLFHNNYSTPAKLYVVRNAPRALLGKRELENLNLVQIVQSLSSQSIVSRFRRVFSGVGSLDVAVDIRLSPDAKPVIQPYRRIPLALRGPVEDELNRLSEANIIEKVKEPCEWLSPIVVTHRRSPEPGKVGAIRLCVDFRQINKFVIRERHIIPSPEELFASMHDATVFSELDARSGFHQFPLTEEASRLTSFVTHAGVFRYRRLPFGISCASEIFQRILSEKFADLSGVAVFIDNIIVFGKDEQDHNENLRRVLQRCLEINLTLNSDKCKFSQKTITVLGHQLSADGVAPDPQKVAALREMSPPKDVSGARRFLGYVNFMTKFSADIAEVSKPIRNLIKAHVPFHWSAACQQSFDDIKASLSRNPVLAFYNPRADTIISCDASGSGLGSVLLQKQSDGQFKPVSYASRSLTDVEVRYSQIEKETLAIVFGCTRFDQYIAAKHFTVYSDHKPLQHIFAKCLDQCPPRIQRWKLALARYSFTLLYRPGQSLVIADMLSRAHRNDLLPSPPEITNLSEFVDLLSEVSLVSSKEIAEATQKCGTLQSVIEKVQSNNWSHCVDTERPYFHIRDALTVNRTKDGNILMWNSRLVIPQSLRERILQLAHTGHPGVIKFKDLLRASTWWPHQTSDAEKFVRLCDPCAAASEKPHAEPMQIVDPSSPWGKLGIDIVFLEGRPMLSVVDYATRFVEVIEMQSTSSEEVIKILSEIFARFGIPFEIVSDNGKQFVSGEMFNFCKRLRIRHIRSSPRYPQSNGRIERVHKVLKK